MPEPNYPSARSLAWASEPRPRGSGSTRYFVPEPKRLSRRSGQATIEFALIYGVVIVPLLFGLIFTAQLCWVWHSMVEFTREGARYAATHCWQSDGQNVISYMQSNVPPNVDSFQFQAGGGAQITVQYFQIDPDSRQLVAYGCGTDCSANCVPDVVTVSVTNYQFQHYSSLLKSIALPPFTGSQAIGSNGCDETGTCVP